MHFISSLFQFDRAEQLIFRRTIATAISKYCQANSGACEGIKISQKLVDMHIHKHKIIINQYHHSVMLVFEALELVCDFNYKMQNNCISTIVTTQLYKLPPKLFLNDAAYMHICLCNPVGGRHLRSLKRMWY